MAVAAAPLRKARRAVSAAAEADGAAAAVNSSANLIAPSLHPTRVVGLACKIRSSEIVANGRFHKFRNG